MDILKAAISEERKESAQAQLVVFILLRCFLVMGEFLPLSF